MKIFGFEPHVVKKRVWRYDLPASLDWEDKRLDVLLPKLNTAAEYAQEAREEPPLLRPFGLSEYSALTSTGKEVLARRYVRQKQWTGYSAWKQFTAIWFVPFFLAGPGGVGAGLWYESVTQTAVATVPWWFAAGMVTGVGVMLFGTMAYMGAHLLKYKLCYARTVLFEQAVTIFDVLGDAVRVVDNILGRRVSESEPEDPAAKRLSLITGRVIMFTPRLAYIDRMDRGRYYAGARGKSGLRKAEVHLQIPEGKKVHDLDDPKEVYEFWPRKHLFTGNTGSWQYIMLALFVNIGRLLFNEKNKNRLQKFIRDNWVFLVVGAELLYMLYMMDNAGAYTEKIITLAQKSAEVTAGVQR